MNQNRNNVINLLKYTFGLVPIVAGLDKFTNILTDWSQYISPGFINTMPFEPSTLMIPIGIVEIVAGILVLFKTKIGAFLLAIWLFLIALTLFLSGNFFDVAVRDIVMCIAAFSLFKLTAARPLHKGS